MSKAIQELLDEKLKIQLEINRLKNDLYILRTKAKEMFEAAGEARQRKDRLEEEAEEIKVNIGDLKESHTVFVTEIHESLRFVEKTLETGTGHLKELNGEFDKASEMLESVRDQQGALEKEIEARKKATRVIVRDLNIYADRLTEAYKFNLPNRKVVVGDIEKVNGPAEEPKPVEKVDIDRKDIPEIPGFDMSKIVI